MIRAPRTWVQRLYIRWMNALAAKRTPAYSTTTPEQLAEINRRVEAEAEERLHLAPHQLPALDEDPDVRHLEGMGLVEWRDGQLRTTARGELVHRALRRRAFWHRVTAGIRLVGWLAWLTTIVVVYAVMIWRASR